MFEVWRVAAELDISCFSLNVGGRALGAFLSSMFCQFVVPFWGSFYVLYVFECFFCYC